jgi:apoptosis-inducing factor 3
MWRRRNDRSTTPRRDDWVALCRRDSLVEGRGRPVHVAGLALAVFLSDGQVYATHNQCPHREVPIDDGLVGDGCVSCPWHSWRFDLTTGEHLTAFGRRRGLATYPVLVADNTVWVERRRLAVLGA